MISIIIPNYNGIDIINLCLQSIYDQIYSSIEIIVVDDCSSDDSVKYLKKEAEQGRIILIQNNKNLGYSGSCFVGARKALGEILIFMNSDAFFIDNFHLSKVLQKFKNNINLGVLGFFQKNQDQSPQFVGSNVDIFLNINPSYKKSDFMLNERNNHILMTGGACFAISKNLYNYIGGIDKNYFLYVEELDLMWRATLMGYDVLTSFDMPIIHLGGKSTKNEYTNQTNSKKIYFRERNVLMTMIKNYSLLSLLLILPLYYIFQVLEIIYLVFKRKFNVIKEYFNANYYVYSNIKLLLKKRNDIQNKRVISDYTLFKSKKIVFSLFKIKHIFIYGIPKIK